MSDVPNLTEMIDSFDKAEAPVEAAAEAVTTPEIDPLNTPEINRAAKEFKELVPRIKATSRNLNARGIARVLTAVVEFPLGNEYPKFRSPIEQQLFMMCLHAQGCKDTMTEIFLKSAEGRKQIEDEVSTKVVEKIMETKENT